MQDRIVYYTSNDCSGAPYLDASDLPVTAYAMGRSGKSVGFDYPAPPYQVLPISSALVALNCNRDLGLDMMVGTYTRAQLTAVPPFSIK